MGSFGSLPREWWNGIHNRLKICRLSSALRVRVPPLAQKLGHMSKEKMMDNLISRAMGFAKSKHSGQTDDDGKGYFEAHCEAVAEIVEGVTDDPMIVAAAYLHDTIEDTDTTYEELVEEFGLRVADLVNEVTHEGAKDSYGFYFPRLESRDAIMIKLADRLSNISRMDAWSENRKRQYLGKTRFWKNGEGLKTE